MEGDEVSDWRSIKDDREKYAAYLCSREWSVLKKAVHERARGRCERCEINQIDAIHHLTYIRKYREDLGDLQAICNLCHGFVHGKSDFDPRLLCAKSLRECWWCKYSSEDCERLSLSFWPYESLERSAAVIRAHYLAEGLKNQRLSLEEETRLLECLVMERRIAQGKEATHGR